MSRNQFGIAEGEGSTTKILNVVDISFRGQSSFYKAIELSAEKLLNVNFVQEQLL